MLNKYRKRIYEIIEVSENNDVLSSIYDFFMMGVIIASIVPLAFKETNIVFEYVDYFTVIVFVIDYLLRLITADFKLKKNKLSSFFIYPFTPMAIIDVLSILPSLSILNSSFKLLKLFRLLRTFKVFRVFKFIRYSKSINIIFNVLKRQKKLLIAVGMLAIGYILICALILFNIEPESFKSFFDAVYWATVSLTTVGYGDIYPVTDIGRTITMVSAILGTAIVALPAGIITGGYMKEMEEEKSNKK